MNEKDIMTLAEAVDYFELSRRKFSALLKSRHDFVIIVNVKINLTFTQRN